MRTIGAHLLAGKDINIMEPHVVILLVFLGRENFYYTTLLDSTTIRQIPFDEAWEHGAERPSTEIYGGVARTDGHRWS